MIGRLVWIVALLLVAAGTSYAQLDRQSRFSSELAPGVPEPFRAFAQTHITAAAIAGDDPDRALAEAARLVQRRPLPAEHLRLLAAAQVKAEQYDKASMTIQIAARRGWRDSATQETMLGLALAAGDEVEAARRYAALLNNRRIDDESLVELGSQVFGTDSVNKAGRAGKQAMINLLSGDTRWRSKFLNRGARVMPVDAFTEIVRESAGRGARFDCRQLQGAIRALDQRKARSGQPLKTLLVSAC
jgi:hypothetical protein